MFKAKVFKLGNSKCIYISKKKADLEVGKVYTFEVLDNNVYTSGKKDVITFVKGTVAKLVTPKEPPSDSDEGQPETTKKFDTSWCSKHSGFKGTCGCK